MRQLILMAEGADRYHWNYTASIIAAMVNSNPFRKKGTPELKPSQIHPYEKQTTTRGTRLTKGNIGMLRAFTGKR